jgi:hypothetical protein
MGFCEGGYAWLIEEGRFGDVSLDGLWLSFWAAWPGAIHEGGGRCVAFIDERGDDSQREALGTLVRGGVGGPWGIFINTYEIEATHPAAFRGTVDGYRSKLDIGDKVTLELAPMANPVTGVESHPEIVLPQGLVLKHSTPATLKTLRLSDGIVFEHPGKYGAFGRFAYEGS